MAARQQFKDVGQLQTAQNLPVSIRTSVRFGLAEIDFRRGMVEVALAHISADVDQMLTNSAAIQPIASSHIYLLAYQILYATSDPRAEKLFQHIVNDIQTRAARITDPACRQSFLTQVPYHHAFITRNENAR